MQLRPCGNSDLRLSVLGLGCWEFGGGPYWGDHSQADADAIVRRAVDLGVTYFDTAEAYNDGRSESSLGEALQGVPRDKVVIGTKVAPSNCEPQTLVAHCEASLQRLRTDTIDLYMVHWPITPHSIAHFTKDPILPSVPDAFAALMKLQQQGKVRHIGISNFGVSKMDEALATGVRLAVNQLPYNLLARGIEREALPYCRRRGIGVVGYMALMQGLLADIYRTLDDVPLWQRRTRHFACSRADELCRHGEPGAEAETNQALAAVRAIAAACGMTMPEVAIKWAMGGDGVTCVLAGSRNVAELEANCRAAESPLDAAIVAELTAATDPLLDTLGPSFDYYENPRNDRTR